MINLNALLKRRVEYYEHPWAVESKLRYAQAYLRSLFQAPDVTFVFGKSMPRSGHRFLTDCLERYFGEELAYCGFYSNADCCKKIPCTKPYNASRTNHYFLQKSHDFGFRDSPALKGKYLIQYRSPIPRLQSNYDLHLVRSGGKPSEADFRAFAETETIYFINFYRKWVAASRPNTFTVTYEDLVARQQRTLIAVISFIQGNSSIKGAAFTKMIEQCPVGGNDLTPTNLRNPKEYPYGDAEFFARLERQVADACGSERIKFHFIKAA